MASPEEAAAAETEAAVHSRLLPSGVKRLENSAERLEAWHHRAGATRLSQRLQEKALEFQGLSALKIEQSRSSIGPHRSRAFDEFAGDFIRQPKPERVGRGDNFMHELHHQTRPSLIREQPVGRETLAQCRIGKQLSGPHSVKSRDACHS